jgi:hypothetical protein
MAAQVGLVPVPPETTLDVRSANVTVAAPDAVPADLRFAALWSNPPIRIGKGPLHDLLLRWLGRLDAGAAGHLVAQAPRLDSLARWLIEQGSTTVRRAPRWLPPLDDLAVTEKTSSSTFWSAHCPLVCTS